MKRKRIMAVLTAAAMVAGIAGCASGNAESQNMDAGAKQTPANEASAQNQDASDEERIEISLWHIWPEGNGGTADCFQQTLEAMKEKFPEVDFVVDAVADSGDAYKTKIKTAIAGNEAPDIFYTWGGGFSQSFIDAGKVLCLDDYIDQTVKDRLIEGTTNYFTYDEKLYGLPTRINLGVLYCNSRLFEEAGVTYPETYEELLGAVKTFKDAGYTPMCVGAKDTWTAAMYLNALTARMAGTEYTNQVLNGGATIDTPEILKSVELYQDLIKAGAFDDGAIALSKDESQTAFLSGKIPMYIHGSWLCSNIFDSEVRDDIVVRNIPVVEGGKGTDTEFLGGADQTFMINSAAKHPEKVAEVYQFMCETFSEKIYMSGNGLPTWKGDFDTSAIENKLIVEAAELYEKSSGLSLWWDTALTGEAATNHLETVTETFMLSITPKEFIEKHKTFLQ